MVTKDEAIDDVIFISEVAHVVGRAGLAMAGVMCGTFVAAALTKVNAEWFDSAPFVATMVLVGMVGFYLGIDIPRLRPPATARPRIDPVELLSAVGTFLATVAALISIYSFVFDEALGGFEYVVASSWLLGVAMQIGAGAIGRRGVAGPAAA
ncbi:MAG: hypothetical protein JOY90_36985 [Bradyrhizobium sp.]|uniref:hypothetical protein n=1 Tax=Bradyrhizobium sp. TaxID=376 RepID=UPI001D1B912F|nr:hypothetical protein [Bradyrhizobium sp.]MBV9566006.1 hypothetical protein [Bradyrhizobium sp.]